MSTAPLPTEITLHKKSRTLELAYGSERFELTAEYLRVYSPSAEVRGHGIGNGVLQTGKKLVGIKELIPAGNYAIKIVFDDGHDSGLYTWDCLHDLAYEYDHYWAKYLNKLAEAGESRDGGMIARG
jgi:DUF971 family protein